MFLLILGVSFGNFWIWKILKENLIIGLLLLALNLLILRNFTNNSKRIYFLAGTVFIILSILILRNGFDKGIFTLDPDETQKIANRHGYYSSELGPFFLNKPVLYFYKNIYPTIFELQRNFLYSLDPNIYFFTGHPRERYGISEFDKYPFILFPLFFIGVIAAVYQKRWSLSIYILIATLVSAFVRPSYLLGPMLIFPAVNFLELLGLKILLNMFKK